MSEEQTPQPQEAPAVEEQQQPQEVDPFTVQPDDLLAKDEADPFAELMATDPMETEESVSPESQTVNEDMELQGEVPKDDQNQYQYWQSQADKRSKELNDVLGRFGVESVDELQSKYADIQDIAPIARYIKSNPNVLDNVEASLSNGQAQGQPQEGNQEPSLKQPEKPTKPSSYDAIDAYSDPESESFKYRERVEAYRDSMIDYSRQENDMLKQQIALEQEQAQQRQQQNQLKNDLVSKHKMQPDEVDKFINYMSSPESVSVDNLVTLWKNQQSIGTQEPAPQKPATDPTAEAMIRQREKLSMPQPVSVTPGGDKGADRGVNDTVMDAMISDYKKQNPW